MRQKLRMALGVLLLLVAFFVATQAALARPGSVAARTLYAFQGGEAPLCSVGWAVWPLQSGDRVDVIWPNQDWRRWRVYSGPGTNLVFDDAHGFYVGSPMPAYYTWYFGADGGSSFRVVGETNTTNLYICADPLPATPTPTPTPTATATSVVVGFDAGSAPSCAVGYFIWTLPPTTILHIAWPGSGRQWRLGSRPGINGVLDTTQSWQVGSPWPLYTLYRSGDPTSRLEVVASVDQELMLCEDVPGGLTPTPSATATRTATLGIVTATPSATATRTATLAPTLAPTLVSTSTPLPQTPADVCSVRFGASYVVLYTMSMYDGWSVSAFVDSDQIFWYRQTTYPASDYFQILDYTTNPLGETLNVPVGTVFYGERSFASVTFVGPASAGELVLCQHTTPTPTPTIPGSTSTPMIPSTPTIIGSAEPTWTHPSPVAIPSAACVVPTHIATSLPFAMPQIGGIIIPNRITRTPTLSPLPEMAQPLPEMAQPLLSATEIVAFGSTVVAGVAAPADKVAILSSGYTWQSGIVAGSAAVAVAQPGLYWLALVNPANPAWDAVGGPLWAIAPVFRPIMPILATLLLVSGARFMLWVGDWFIRIVTLILDVIKLLPFL